MPNIHQKQIDSMEGRLSINQSSMEVEQLLNCHLSITNDGWTLGELTSVLWVKEEHVTVVEERLGQVVPGLCCQKLPTKDSNTMLCIKRT